MKTDCLTSDAPVCTWMGLGTGTDIAITPCEDQDQAHALTHARLPCLLQSGLVIDARPSVPGQTGDSQETERCG